MRWLEPQQLRRRPQRSWRRAGGGLNETLEPQEMSRGREARHVPSRLRHDVDEEQRARVIEI